MIAHRYDKQQPIMISRNKAFSDWREVFAGDAAKELRPELRFLTPSRNSLMCRDFGRDLADLIFAFGCTRCQAFGIGRAASMSDPSGSTAYAYSRRGALLHESKTIDGSPFVQSYGYDADGNRTKWPMGSDLHFERTYLPHDVKTGA